MDISAIPEGNQREPRQVQATPAILWKIFQISPVRFAVVDLAARTLSVCQCYSQVDPQCRLIHCLTLMNHVIPFDLVADSVVMLVATSTTQIQESRRLGEDASTSDTYQLSKILL